MNRTILEAVNYKGVLFFLLLFRKENSNQLKKYLIERFLGRSKRHCIIHDLVFENNVMLTKTERLIMGNRSKNPANAMPEIRTC